MNPRLKMIFPLLLTFLGCTVVFAAGLLLPIPWKIDYAGLIGINCFFFMASLFIFRIQLRALQNENPNVFVRSIMSGTLIKMLICVAVIVAYVLLNGKAFSRPVVYISMLLYVVYLVAETRLLMKLNKNRNAPI